MSGTGSTGRSTGAATPPPVTFSPTVIALMVCVPLAVLILIIVVVCICVRRGDSGQRTDTYEDFSKVDQTVMLRMSMNVIEDRDHVVLPEDINHLENDLINDPVKSSHETEKWQDGYQKHESPENVSQNNKQEDSEINTDSGSDDKINTGTGSVETPGITVETPGITVETPGITIETPGSATHKGDNSSEVTMRDKTKPDSETGNDTKQEDGDTVGLVPAPVSDKSSGDYYTLKANYLPPPE